MGDRTIDMSGKRIGKLHCLRKSDKKLYGSNQAIWECKCDCGNEILVPGQALRKDTTRSCRDCYTSGSRVIGTTRNTLYLQCRQGANDRGYDFSITREEFAGIISKDCRYCGIKPFATRGPEWDRVVYNGVDREDNTRGYVLDNCVPCCKVCNVAKRSLTVEEFLTWVRRIYEHNYGGSNT
jgi:hypothetical protein